MQPLRPKAFSRPQTWAKSFSLLKKYFHFSEKEIKRLTFKQAEIYLDEITESKIEDCLIDYIKAGGKPKELEKENPLHKKWLEMNGQEEEKETTKEIKKETSDELDYFVDKLKNTDNRVEELKNIFKNSPDIKDA